MSTPASTPEFTPARPAPPANRRLFGFLLLIPALLALIVGFAVPTLLTLWDSFNDVDPFGEGRDEFVGLDNYTAIAGDFARSVGVVVPLILLPLLTVAVLAPALSWLATLGGTAARRVVRLALALPLAMIAPATLAGAWMTRRRTEGNYLINLSLTTWLTLLGLLLALGITVYLAAFRQPDPSPAAWVRPVLAVLAVVVIATIAYGLQSFTYPEIITGGGPRNETTTPLIVSFNESFRFARLGVGAAVSILLFLLLALLGVGAVLVLLLSRLRADVDPPGPVDRRPSVGATVGAIAAVVVLLTVVLYGLWPYLGGLGGQGLSQGAVRTQLYTWVPSFVSALVGVLVAAVAGFGIGGLRPLGRRSELLLLPFAPWLFVGTGVFGGTYYGWWRDLDLVDKFIGLMPPIWVSLPALVVFTLLFRGLGRRWREGVAGGAPLGSAFTRTVLLPALPMVGVVTLLVWIARAQELMWPLLVAPNPEHVTGPLSFFNLGRTAFFRDVSTGVAYPVVLLALFALALAAAQWFYLDRLALRADPGGREE